MLIGPQNTLRDSKRGRCKMVVARRLVRGVAGTLIGVSVIIVGLAVVGSVPTAAQYILVLGIFVGCYLSVKWGFGRM